MSLISSRIESWPFSRFHKRLLMAGGLGFMFDALDASAVAFVLPVLRTQWGLTSVQTGLLGSGTYIGFFFGALSAGVLGDLLGRRRVMLYALAIYTLASLGAALTHSLPMFLALRIIAGFGTGAESSVISPYLAEFVMKRYRGTFVGSLVGFCSFGAVSAALLSSFIVPSGPNGWRIMLIVTSAPILALLWWRRILPESPRWLESRGLHREAVAVVDKIERELVAQGYKVEPRGADTSSTAGETAYGQQNTAFACGAPLSAMSVPAAEKQSTPLENFKALWVGRQARTTALVWVLWVSITFSYYSLFTWIPGLLIAHGFHVTKSFSYSLAIYFAQIPGYFSAAWLNDRLGRQITTSSYLLLGGISALAMALVNSDAAIVAAGVFLSFFMNGAYSGVYAYTAELFPTAIRATGVGMASGVGRLGAIGSTILVGFIYPIWGFGGVFTITTLVLLSGTAAVLLIGIKTKGVSLEEIEKIEASET